VTPCASDPATAPNVITQTRPCISNQHQQHLRKQTL